MFVLMQSGIIVGIAAFKHKHKLVINMLRNFMPWANLNFLHKYLLIYLHYLNPCLRGLDLLVKISEHTHTHTHTQNVCKVKMAACFWQKQLWQLLSSGSSDFRVVFMLPVSLCGSRFGSCHNCPFSSMQVLSPCSELSAPDPDAVSFPKADWSRS